MSNRFKMVLLLNTLLITILVGCLNKKDKLNDYEIHKLISRFNIQEKEEFKLPEIEKPIVEEDKIYLGDFLITGYCDCPICQEEWVGTTALGVAPTANWTIAVDPNIISLGSLVEIDGVTYCAEDVGGMINDNHIDMFMGSHEECYSEICNGYKSVYLLNGGNK